MSRLFLPEDLSEVFRELERAYPFEGCGLILRGPDGALRVRPMQNIAERKRVAYRFDPSEHIRVLKEARSRGEEQVCIFHSHVDADAYFSAEDRRMAAVDGQPLLPGVAWLVVAVHHGRAAAARLYEWDGVDFAPSAVLPGSSGSA